MRNIIESKIKNIVKNKYNQDIDINLEVPDIISYGDFALPCFTFAKVFRKSPNLIANELKELIESENLDFIDEISTVGAYLNLKLKKQIYFEELYKLTTQENNIYGFSDLGKDKSVMVEFSSPNTNKPLHLGHIRTTCLGDSIGEIFNACGYKVIKANLLNDRGIHICKAMLAWKKFSNGETPETAGMKGDHFVGKYYVIFEQKLKEEENKFIQENNIDLSVLEDREKQKLIEEKFYPESILLTEAREMLRKWEDGDKETLELWDKLNQWVYNGFNETYEKLGINFDKYYYESNTFKLGKDYVLEGLKKGVCYQKEDGSIWIKLPEKEFNHDKLLVRKDGTTVYLTQDIGTAYLKYNEFKIDKSIYVVASEQDYHFKVLFKSLELLGFEKADGCYHLSYGMVSLPEGRMKSREGKVVDADDLINEMYEKAKEEIVSRNRPFSGEELENISNIVALGALKFYILQYSAKTDFCFDPKASIDFNGKTGPYIQYTHARICSLLKQLDSLELNNIDFSKLDSEEEVVLFRLIEKYPFVVKKACETYNTSFICEYLYDLASAFNTFYSKADNRIKEMNEDEQKPKLALANSCKIILNNGLNLLGITAPEQM